jgi:hypothetical protein
MPRRRPGRSPDELALRNAFVTFFPGAQWVGDGTQVPVVIDGQRFTFNLELDVDAYSAALVGADVAETEDAAAVVAAFDDGVSTTGAPPLALLLDNRESNHTQTVADALGDTIKIRATPGRAPNKAHVEGAFGLFEHTAPPLAVTATSPRQLAEQLLALVVKVYAPSAPGGKQHIVRLDVAMNHAATVRFGQPVGDARANPRESLLTTCVGSKRANSWERTTTQWGRFLVVAKEPQRRGLSPGRAGTQWRSRAAA